VKPTDGLSGIRLTPQACARWLPEAKAFIAEVTRLFGSPTGVSIRNQFTGQENQAVPEDASRKSCDPLNAHNRTPNNRNS
jgi:hypothetical protein